jgi:predicted secreted protein
MNDSGKTINVADGAKFKVELVSNRSTGNNWTNLSYDKEIIKLTDEPVYQQNKSGLTGAPGTVTYTFKALKPGNTDLKMEYVPIGNPHKDPLKTFSVSVVVKEHNQFYFW